MLTPGAFLSGGLRNESSQTGPAYEARAAYFERINRFFGLLSRLAERGRHPYDAVNCRRRAIARLEQVLAASKRTYAPHPADAPFPGPTTITGSDCGKEENHDEPGPHA
jgi:cytochrome c556